MIELYKTIADWIGWPILVAGIIAAGSYGFWVMQQRIEALKERIDSLEKENSDLKELRPDILAERQARRLAILTEELERLHQDEEKNRELIEQKEGEISIALDEMRNLQEELDKAKFTLRNYNTIISDLPLTEFMYGIENMLEVTSNTLSQIEFLRRQRPEDIGAPVPNLEEKMIHELVSELADKSSDIRTSARVLRHMNLEASEFTKIYIEEIESTIIDYVKKYAFSPLEPTKLPNFAQMRELEGKLSELKDGLEPLSNRQGNRK